MTRQFWSAFACLVIVVLGIGGVVFNGDIYDTRSPVYALIAHMTPQADFQRAETYVHLVRAQDINGLKSVSVLPLAPNMDKIAAQVASYYPNSPQTAVAPVQYGLSSMTDGTRTATITINHTYADGSVIFTTTVFDNVTHKVKSFNFRKLTAKDLKLIKFNPLNADVTQAFVLLLATATFVFTLATLYACLANTAVKWKWLWFIFITAGIFSIRFNWLTEVLSVAPIDVRWGAAGYFQNLFEPVMIYINMPVGAVVYWLTRKRAVSVPVLTNPE